MSISFEKAFGVHADALALRSQRAGLLAANLANADTPGYKARDVDFRALLAGAEADLDGPRLRVTDAAHIAPGAAGLPGGEPLYRVPLQASLDGNTVDTQLEQSAVMRNALQYQASLTFLNGKIRGLLTALKGE